MAYGVKFRLNFAALQNNGDNSQTTIEYEADILQNNYVGGITLVKGIGEPIQIKLPQFDDVFEPVCSSNATITLISETLDQFVEFQTADVYEFILDIKRDGVTFWQGVFITEPYTERFVSAPYPVKLTFNDGLSELQFERFDDSGALRAGFTTVMAILTKCFSFLPFTRKTRELINIFEDTFNDADTEGLLEQLAIYEQAFWEVDKSDDKIKGENCLEVIRGIMSSLKCRIIVSQDIWYIIRIGEMFDTSIKFVEYDISGVAVSNSTIDLRQAINQSGIGNSLLRHLAGGNNAISREYQEVEFKYTSKHATTLDNNVTINGNFAGGFELENGSPVPLFWVRSSALNTQIGVTATGLHLDISGAPIPNFIQPFEVLVMEDSLLQKTKIISNPVKDTNDQLDSVVQAIPAQVTRETFSLLSESPADSTITVKNLLTDTSDHLQITIRGHLDFTYADPNNAIGNPLMFNKWKVQLGSNFYNTGNQTWSADSNNRTWSRVWGNFNTNISLIINEKYRVVFDETITLANFPADSIDDLTITWFIPETLRAPNNLGNNEAISEIEIVFELMEFKYISNNSTEFSIQKALGETGSNTLRSRRFEATVKHGDGPSNFSVMSFRKPTNNLATTTWSTRGGSEAKAGLEILVIDPIFENLGTLRQVFSGKLYGFLELHNTISLIDSKVFAIKGYDFKLKSNTFQVKVHEVGTFTPIVIIVQQFSLSGFTNPTDSEDDDSVTIDDALTDADLTTQGTNILNTQQTSTTQTTTIRNNNDSPETASNWPL